GGSKLLGEARGTDSCNCRCAEREDHRKGGFKGFDGGKKIKGRKRYMMVDTRGNILAAAVTAANLSDQQGLYLLLDTFRFKKLRKIWADMGFQGEEAKGYAAR